MKQGFIYKVTNTVNGSVYVGQTIKTIQTRWKAHVCASLNKSSNTFFHKAIRKHGPDSFELEVLAEVPHAYLDSLEELFISLLNSNDRVYGYNGTAGGAGDATRCERISKSNTGKKQSAETIAKRVAKMVGHDVPQETRDKIAAKATGRGHSDEIKAELAAKSKALWADPTYRAMMMERRKAQRGKPAWNKGLTSSDETKAKIGKAGKGRTPWNKNLSPSQETRDKISAANKGRDVWNTGRTDTKWSPARRAAYEAKYKTTTK